MGDVSNSNYHDILNQYKFLGPLSMFIDLLLEIFSIWRSSEFTAVLFDCIKLFVTCNSLHLHYKIIMKKVRPVYEGKDEDIIRIISSRKPTKNEQKVFFERLL
jgi:hypothetical protein